MTQIQKRPVGAGRNYSAGQRSGTTGDTKTSKCGCQSPAKTFIQVDEQYAIGADAYSWHILERHRYKGGHRWEPILWFATLEHCANALTDLAVRTCGAHIVRPIGRV